MFQPQVKQLQRQKESLEDRLNSSEIENRKLSAKVDVLEREKKSAETKLERVKEDSEAKLTKIRAEKDALEDR